MAINQLLFYEGLNLTTPINASLMMTSTPILVLIISSIIIHERITLNKIIGIALGASGAILLLLSSHGTDGQMFWGDFFILINAASYAIFLVLVKPLAKKYNPATIVLFMFSMGLLMVLPFGFKDTMAVDWANMPGYVMLSLGFILVFATLIAYYFNVGVLRYVNPSIAGIYIYLQPIITAFIAISFGKDEFTMEKGLYSMLIFTGVFLVSRKNGTVNAEVSLEKESLDKKS